jgi:XrtJ-associated TM-motif-TM protein
MDTLRTKSYAVALVAVAAFLGLPAMAQIGCTNSPENPTAILALVGAAGGAFVALRARVRR